MRSTAVLGLLLLLCSLTANAEPSALEHAVRQGDTDQVIRLLDDGADPDSVSDSGSPVLVLAAAGGSKAMVELLLSKGANPDAVTSGGYKATALMHASGGPNAEIASSLIAAGADVDARDAMGDPAINWASYYGNTDYVAVLLAAGADATLRGHGNAFEIAIRRGHEDIVRMTASPTGNQQEVSASVAAVVESLASGKDDQATELVRGLGDSDGVVVDSFGRPLLHVAASNAAEETTRALLERFGSVDATDVIGFTAIMHAARSGDSDLVRELIAAGAEVNHRSKPTGLSLTPLHLAAIGGDATVVTQLIEDGADVNVQGRDGGTPLHWAMFENKKDSARALIGAGANLDLPTRTGQTPRELLSLLGWDDLDVPDDAQVRRASAAED